MLEQFHALNEEEFVKLKDAIPLITVLIAGADGHYEKDQLVWADKVTKIRGYKMKDAMKSFYQEVGKTFSIKLNLYMDTFPQDVHERNNLIGGRLAQLNPILAKLESHLAAEVYKSFVSFAKHVAKASGGLFGFFAINKEEAKLIGLPMITPIHVSTEEEE
ncbi:MAG: hypothetical protein H7X99_07660 [Saprospiraceae bacterium]|nr:hypothetical protein [Saprospiraceae bacterium]